MAFDPFSVKGVAGHPFSEMDKLNKLLSAADPVLKLQSSISQMKHSPNAMIGVDLSAFRAVFNDHARFTDLHSEQLRLTVRDSERFRSAITAAGEIGTFVHRPIAASLTVANE